MIPSARHVTPWDAGANQVLDADDVAPTTELKLGPRTSFPKPGLVFVGLGLFLAVAFFPLLFNNVATYDDEGFFLVTVRQFLHHGSLYVHTLGTSYGPFYWSFIGLIYRLTGHSPSPFSGRLLVLAFTALSSGIFAAAVWRVTRNLLFSTLCQVATFCSLILVAGQEPISPGSTIVLLLSILIYALASYSVKQRNSLLVIAGDSHGCADDDQDQHRDLCGGRAGCRVGRWEFGIPEMVPQHYRSRSHSPALRIDVSTDL